MGRVGVLLPPLPCVCPTGLSAKLRENEGNAKGKLTFLFISECM